MKPVLPTTCVLSNSWYKPDCCPLGWDHYPVFSEMPLIIRTMCYALILSALSDMMLERLFCVLDVVQYDLAKVRSVQSHNPTFQ
jgi:hypothetical protein